jgi:chorismate dehydratase
MPLRIACVGFLNTRPLIAGLEQDAALKLSFFVPSKLLGEMENDRADVALLPVIDYQRSKESLRVIPAGGIGCDGPTLTVRVFSHEPMDQIRVVATDPDSHTSVALARILFRKRFGTDPEFIDLARARGGEAQLLIGDKVICEEPVGFTHQLDLGAAWKKLTGLPFVFAVWCARPGVLLGDLPKKLVAARERGLASARQLVDKHGVPRGWPAGVALQYLTVYLHYDIGERQLEAIRTFHELAAECGVIPSPVRPLDLVSLHDEPRAGHLWSGE